MALTAGTILGQYEIRSPLGAGGMGEVYRAHDKRLDRDVAIKVLPEYLTSDRERLSRFEQEARATAALNHPNILAVYQMATDNGVSYLVEELLEGETLRDLLRRGPVSLRKTIDYAVQIAHGLAAAHDKGIVHRDLKPENLFVTKDGRVKILDFGLARLVSPQHTSGEEATVTQKTDPGVVLGTAGYMSPEQVRGQIIDHRTDIFAFGTVLYEMVSGKQPFRKSTSAETMSAILNEEPPSLSQISATTPPGLQRVVHRCLEKDSEHRFHSAHDLAFALEAMSDSGRGTSTAAQQPASSKKWVWVATSAAFLAIVAAAIIWWNRPPAVPVVEGITQLTDDGVPKRGYVVSDGSRIYFTEGTGGSSKAAQVSVAGGETSIVTTRLPDSQVVALAPDGSSLLLHSGDITLPLWTLPLPTGEPRRLEGITAFGADYFPDGQLAFIKDSALYVAGKGGSNIRKLIAVPSGADCLSVSRDRTIVFRTWGDLQTYSEVGADENGIREIMKGPADASLGCPFWTPDGKYLIYRILHAGRYDIWAVAAKSGLFQRFKLATQLTNGPLSYDFAMPGRDGKRIFAIGKSPRGELIRYDLKTHQFVPFLGGISAIDPTFSRDGQWVAYVAASDHTLWRSRTDGTERMQLTFPPMEVGFPVVSQDGSQVAFQTRGGDGYVTNMNGGELRKFGDRNSQGGSLSPDGKSIVFSATTEAKPGEQAIFQLRILTLASGNLSVIPSGQNVFGPFWVDPETIVAAERKENIVRLVSFNLKTEKWTDLASGAIAAWMASPDGKYLYYDIGGTDPKAMRVRVADRQIETLVSLKDLRRLVDPVEGFSQINVAPDGSPVFTRDIGTQEIYALTIRWP